MRNSIVCILLSAVILLAAARPCPAMTRTLMGEPAIVLVAFGTTTRASATYAFFEEQLRRELPDEAKSLRIEWAFTSEIVRERANRKFAEQGSPQRYRSLKQVLADLDDAGYRKIALQPLHIFPGQEYEELETVLAAFRSMGMTIEAGGALFHRWEWMFEAVDILAPFFLPPEEGSTILVAHGSPLSFVGANSAYLGLARYLQEKYPNVFLGGVDGVLTREQALNAAKARPQRKVRFVPLMFVAGDHIMNDIMGGEPDQDGTLSWAMELAAAGKEVETLKITWRGEEHFQGLGFHEKIDHLFIRQLADSLGRLE